MRFGVTAYRHYIGPDGGPEYLRDILAGRAMARGAEPGLQPRAGASGGSEGPQPT